MNTLIWILQALMALVFGFSGINKAYFDEPTLVQKGQTGVEGYPMINYRYARPAGAF